MLVTKSTARIRERVIWENIWAVSSGQKEESVPKRKSRQRWAAGAYILGACINFVPLSPAGTCVFMRHSEAYKRRAISDTIKMCISRCCVLNATPAQEPRPVTLSRDVRAQPISTYTALCFISLFRFPALSTGRNNNPAASFLAPV